MVTAINHWPRAIETHTTNHPDARHLCTGIDSVNPRELYEEGQLDLLWASPECTHHSIARGGRPINDQSRATAWCVVRWAEAVRPPVILIENVPEFQSWGPIGSKSRPLASRKGETFRAWLAALESLGYKTDYRLLCAADYGDPTTRTRLFVQAVRGRRKIVWPEPTHTKDPDLMTERRWTPAKEIIDWDLPSGSIFERKRPLSPKTLARIEAGLKKFGLGDFFMTVNHGDAAGSGSHESRVHDPENPLGVITCKNCKALVQPYIVEWDHQSGGNGVRGQHEPLSTVTTKARHGVAQPFLVELRGTKAGQLKSTARSLSDPSPTITAGGVHLGLVEPCLLPQQSDGRLRPVSEPTPTVATAGAIALVEPFLVSYYGNGEARDINAPLDTVTTKDRFGLVRPVVECAGKQYQLDIHFRMLQPHELAAAQGFPKDYQFTGTKTDQVKQIGNAVPRRLARALVAAVVGQNPDVSALVDAEEGREEAA